MTVKEYVEYRKNYLKEYIDTLDINDRPKLAIIQINEDQASNTYVNGKKKDLDYINALYDHIQLPIDTTEEKLHALIDQLNGDDSIHGILVQMPLPKHINEEKVKRWITPNKDVDGFHPLSEFVPCTPKGIMDYLKEEKVEFLGKNAVVIGRSNIVGRPMAKLLLDESCNVTVCHSKTPINELKDFIKKADIIVVAVGKKHLLNHEFEVKKTAVLVDVGINRIDGKLYGDIEPDFDCWIQTPVPGGVGLLTRVSMIENLILCYKLNKKIN